MRVSVEDDYAMFFEVWFNGERLDRCIEADDQEGWAIVLEEADDGQREQRKLFGNVRFELIMS